MSQLPSPRDFAAGEDPGYHNATLGTSGVAIPFPRGARGCVVSVGAGCYVGVRETDTLATFDDDHYGSILNGQPHTMQRISRAQSSWLHIAAWTSTTSVALYFW